MKDCQFLEGYLDGELPAEQADRFCQHAMMCAKCQNQLEAQAEFERLVAAARDQFDRRHRTDCQDVAVLVRRRIKARRIVSGVGIVAASLAATIVIALGTMNFPSSPQVANELTVDESIVIAPELEPVPDETHLASDRVEVTTTVEADYLAEPVRTQNPNVTIYWLHPTIKVNPVADSTFFPNANETLLARRTP